MKNFIRIILVLGCLLAVFTNPVKADDVLDPGDIAIIGFNSDGNSQFAFVCLREISAGTVVYFTDNGWMATSDTFRTGEGRLTWETPGGCQLGQIVTIDQYDLPTIGTFQLSNGGDQILVYQGSDELPTFIFAINFEQSDWQINSSSANTSARPKGLDATNSVALVEIDNSIYPGTKSFERVANALAAIVDKTIWTGSDTVRQVMPTGSFSFTTTAVHLSDVSAESGSESPPLWVLLGLVAIPVLIMVFRRPKRDCCK